MAVNEKPVYATSWTTHGRHLFRPGEQMTGKVSEAVIRHGLEGGVASDSHAEAQRAERSEAERVAYVGELQATRSDKATRETAPSPRRPGSNVGR